MSNVLQKLDAAIDLSETAAELSVHQHDTLHALDLLRQSLVLIESACGEFLESLCQES